MSKEAMTLALEALETAWYHVGTFAPTDDAIELYDQARTSLRQAIAEAEKQEPVAWRNAAIRVGEDLCSVGPFGYYDMTAEQWLDWALSVVTVHLPPQPAQKPLTDEQILADETLRYHFGMNGGAGPVSKKGRAVIDAIEAAHGIKENT